MSILPQALIGSVKHLASRCQAAMLPGSCLLCGGDSAAHLLCSGCLADLPAAPERSCPQCGEPTTHGERCGACLREPPHFAQTIAVWRYDFPLNRVIQALKYRHQIAIARWLGEALAARLTAAGQLIVPLPLHRERIRERGFNQSMEIARALARKLCLPLTADCLLRQRPTLPQADLEYRERQRNVRGAFTCTADLTGRSVILVDDVMTTGATANECARVLGLHGARDITVAVAARALKG